MKILPVPGQVKEAALFDLFQHVATTIDDDIPSIMEQVFDELRSDVPGPILSTFAYYVMERGGLKEEMGQTVLRVLDSASSRGFDIYDVNTVLDSRVQRRSEHSRLS